MTETTERSLLFVFALPPPVPQRNKNQEQFSTPISNVVIASATAMSSLAVEPRRPRLLGRNRKLRHLRGIWLRNLSFAPTSLRTADDADLGTHSSRSPSKKLGVLRESSQLHPSRSTESLRSEGLRQQQQQQQQEQEQELRRPQGVRRTSLSLAHVSPAARQKKLEAAVEEVVGDVFYSLHVDGEEEPVYLSEVRERSAVGARAFMRHPSTDFSV